MARLRSSSSLSCAQTDNTHDLKVIDLAHGLHSHHSPYNQHVSQIPLLHRQRYRLQFDLRRQFDQNFVIDHQSKTTENVEVVVIKYKTQYS